MYMFFLFSGLVPGDPGVHSTAQPADYQVQGEDLPLSSEPVHASGADYYHLP